MYASSAAICSSFIRFMNSRKHNLAAVLNPDFDVVTAWTTLRQGQPGVLEQMVEAGTDFPGGFLSFVDVVAHGAVLAVKALAQTSDGFFPRWRRLFCGQKGEREKYGAAMIECSCPLHPFFSTLEAPAW